MAQAPKYRSVWQKMLLEEAEREKRARAAGAGNTPRQDDWQLPEPGAWAMVPVVGPAYEAAYDMPRWPAARSIAKLSSRRHVAVALSP